MINIVEKYLDLANPVPGIYPGLSFDYYCKIDAVNASRLKSAHKSWKHYKWRLDNPRSDNSAFKLGRAVHDTLDDPTMLAEHYTALPDEEFMQQVLLSNPDCKSPRSTKIYKDLVKQFALDSSGKEILSASDMAAVRGCYDSIRQNQLASELLMQSGFREITLVWHCPDTGILCKGRLDQWQPRLQRFSDLKTCKNLRLFEKDIKDYRYHWSLGWYQWGIEVLTGEVHDAYLVPVEKESEFDCYAAKLSDQYISLGKSTMCKFLPELKQCQETGVWPGMSSPVEFQCPEYLLESFQFEMNGELTT